MTCLSFFFFLKLYLELWEREDRKFPRALLTIKWSFSFFFWSDYILDMILNEFIRTKYILWWLLLNGKKKKEKEEDDIKIKLSQPICQYAKKKK